MFDKLGGLLKNKLGVYYNRILLVILVLLVFSLFSDLSRVNKADTRIQDAEERLGKLLEEKGELELQVDIVNTEEFAEKQIRDKLNLAKEDEIVVVLPDDEVLRKIAPKRIEEKDTLPDPNWRKWLNLFI